MSSRGTRILTTGSQCQIPRIIMPTDEAWYRFSLDWRETLGWLGEALLAVLVASPFVILWLAYDGYSLGFGIACVGACAVVAGTLFPGVDVLEQYREHRDSVRWGREWVASHPAQMR